MTDLPGGPIASRPLRFFWVLDTSSTMSGSKIGELNFAIREALPSMKSTANENPNAQVEIMVLTFGSAVHWLTPAPVPLEQFTWTDISAGGLTAMGGALEEVSKKLSPDQMPDRGLPPVIVLVTDGQPTDDFDKGLKALMDQPWAKRSVRLAIAIGQDADLGPLRRFMEHAELQPLLANNADTLASYIRWASIQVLKSASAPNSTPAGSAVPTSTGSVLPAPPAPDPNAPPPPDVW